MSYPDEGTRAFPRMVLVTAACVAALVVPFLLVSRLAGGPTQVAPPAEHAGAGVAMGGSAAPTGTTPATTRAATTPAVAATGAVPQPDATTSSPDLAAATESCRLANLRLTTALSAADVSLAQFDKHIEAMNLLVAGKISYAVATQFWDETRVGAAQNAAAFKAADTSLRASRAPCSRLDPAVVDTLPYGQVVAVASCASYVSAGAAAMVKARAAVTTWEHHIQDMEMLRMGHITPAQATAMWTRNWHRGDQQLRSYESAERQAKKSRCTLS